MVQSIALIRFRHRFVPAMLDLFEGRVGEQVREHDRTNEASSARAERPPHVAINATRILPGSALKNAGLAALGTAGLLSVLLTLVACFFVPDRDVVGSVGTALGTTEVDGRARRVVSTLEGGVVSMSTDSGVGGGVSAGATCPSPAAGTRNSAPMTASAPTPPTAAMRLRRTCAARATTACRAELT